MNDDERIKVAILAQLFPSAGIENIFAKLTELNGNFQQALDHFTALNPSGNPDQLNASESNEVDILSILEAVTNQAEQNNKQKAKKQPTLHFVVGSLHTGLPRGTVSGCAIDAQGDMYIILASLQAIYKLSREDQYTSCLVAGTPGTAGFQDGPNLSCYFNFTPTSGITYLKKDDITSLFVSDSANHCIRRIILEHSNTTQEDQTSDTLSTSTVAGGNYSGNLDGPKDLAKFHFPTGCCYSKSMSCLLVNDSGNFKVRCVSLKDFSVTTLAGDGASGYIDGAALIARFGLLCGICTNDEGQIFVTETDNGLIRRISDGQVRTIAGDGTPGYADGNGILAKFNKPCAIHALDSGDLVVADRDNHCIRLITNSYEVRTLAGNGVPGLRDGIALNSSFFFPTVITQDPSGCLIVIDPASDIRTISMQEI